jgi:hypothetical protein
MPFLRISRRLTTFSIVFIFIRISKATVSLQCKSSEGLLLIAVRLPPTLIVLFWRGLHTRFNWLGRPTFLFPVFKTIIALALLAVGDLTSFAFL